MQVVRLARPSQELLPVFSLWFLGLDDGDSGDLALGDAGALRIQRLDDLLLEGVVLLLQELVLGGQFSALDGELLDAIGQLAEGRSG